MKYQTKEGQEAYEEAVIDLDDMLWHALEYAKVSLNDRCHFMDHHGSHTFIQHIVAAVVAELRPEIESIRNLVQLSQSPSDAQSKLPPPPSAGGPEPGSPDHVDRG